MKILSLTTYWANSNKTHFSYFLSYLVINLYKERTYLYSMLSNILTIKFLFFLSFSILISLDTSAELWLLGASYDLQVITDTMMRSEVQWKAVRLSSYLILPCSCPSCLSSSSSSSSSSHLSYSYRKAASEHVVVSRCIMQQTCKNCKLTCLCLRPYLRPALAQGYWSLKSLFIHLFV